MAFEVPKDLQYTQDHEWIRMENGRVRIGVTDYAQDQLGDALFVELPEVGSTVHAGERFGEIESSKSVSDLISPAGGTVLEINQSLKNDPELVNSAPYGEGWLILLEPAGGGDTVDLIGAEEYVALINRDE